jgi:hypothetical protein
LPRSLSEIFAAFDAPSVSPYAIDAPDRSSQLLLVGEMSTAIASWCGAADWPSKSS